MIEDSTLTVPLGAFKQGELGWVVHHGELVEQRLDDFSHARSGAYMQVLGSVFGEVERRPPLHPSAPLILILWRAEALTRREGDGTDQLKVDLDETSVGPIFILQGGQSSFCMNVRNGLNILKKSLQTITN